MTLEVGATSSAARLTSVEVFIDDEDMFFVSLSKERMRDREVPGGNRKTENYSSNVTAVRLVPWLVLVRAIP